MKIGLARRLRALLSRAEVEREMDEELRFHLEKETERNVARGMSPEEARRAALVEFGGMERTREECRDERGVRPLEDLWQDLRYGARSLRKSPGFTLVAVVTLALGIGANSAIFSVVNAVLLRALPYERPERLMLLKGASAFPRDASRLDSGAQLIDWRDRTQSFESLAAYGALGGGVNLTGGGEPERVETAEVTVNFFRTMGINPVLGRAFLPEEEEEGKSQVAVISYGLWQRRFGGAADVPGKTVALNGKSFTIIGVTPPGLQYPDKVDLWIPITFSDTDRVLSANVLSYMVVGRLKDGVSLAQAQSEMNVIARWYDEGGEKYPGRRPTQIEVMPLLDQLVQGIRPALLILFAAVAFVLLIACANVTNLLMARATVRRREVAIRAAVGAGRWRLVRQFLAESLLLAAAGGALGLIVAVWGTGLLVSLGPSNIPRLDEVRLDGRVFAFTLGVSLLTGVLFGLVPALQTSKANLNLALKDDAGRPRPDRGYSGLRGLLVVCEVAMALVLMIGAGLLVKSFVRVTEIDHGFKPQNVLSVALDLPDTKYPKAADKNAFYGRLLERLRSVPGTQAVGVTSTLPLSNDPVLLMPFTVEGRQEAGATQDTGAVLSAVGGDYFKAMGIPLLQGRYFTDQDASGSQPVLIVDEVLARRYWPDGGAVGKRLTVRGEKGPREIVGVVGHTRLWPENDSFTGMYAPYLQSRRTPTSVVIRTEADPSGAVTSLRNEIKTLDKDLAAYDVKTMTQRLSDAVAQRRFILLLLGTFAAVALALAAVGLYGIMSYTVSQRTREIGIRMALGARASDVLRMVMKKGLVLACFGVVAGGCGALGLTRLMKALLFGVTATDATTYALLALLLLAVAALACFVPARRATKVDPLVALRAE